MVITGGGNITRFAASAAMIANSLSGQPSLNVRDMRASAKLHKAEPGRSSRKVAASRLFLCLCRDCRSTAEHRQIGQKSVSKRCVFQGKSRLYGLPQTAAIPFPYPAHTGIFVSIWCVFATQFLCLLFGYHLLHDFPCHAVICAVVGNEPVNR